MKDMKSMEINASSPIRILPANTATKHEYDEEV